MRRALTFLLGLTVVSCSSTPETSSLSSASARLRSDTVFALLDVIDTVVEKNADHARTVEALRSMSDDDRARRLAELSDDNAADPEIRRRIDLFLETEAMRIYFGRYKNVAPADYRRALLALPYQTIDAPGDIAVPLFDMVPIKDDLRGWVEELVGHIDVERCREAAARWLPRGDHATPKMFLVYDGNAGSYTAEGKAFYNLYSGIVRDLPRGESPSSTDLEEMEAVISHEMQHVLAEELDRRSMREQERWERARMDRVIRGMVSEGAALHCNPPAGFRKALWQDPTTLEALIAELTRTFLALEEGRMEESEFKTWFSDTFQRIPRKLLRDYIAREYPADEIDDLEIRYASQRPDLLHALGWWMVSRVSREGDDPEAVRQLVGNPYELFSRYNRTLSSDVDPLRIDSRLTFD